MSDDVGKDLHDAIEALQYARKQQERLRREVSKLERNTYGHNDRSRLGPKRVNVDISAPSLLGPTSPQGEQIRDLREKVDRLRATLDEGRNAAVDNTQKVRGHVQTLKATVHAVHSEVDALMNCLRVVEEGCRMGREEVDRLRLNLQAIRQERDEATSAMQHLTFRAQTHIEALRLELSSQERELVRLREQNDFMRLQSLRR